MECNNKNGFHVDQAGASQLRLLLRGSEVAVALGISRALAYRWMAGGVLPVVRRGRSVRVPREALHRWIQENTEQAATAR